MKRYLSSFVVKDVCDKIVFITGPRQCGKTTLSKALFSDPVYLNYDSEEDRLIILRKTWKRRHSLVIFDELHKMQNWKQWLKGIYDTQQPYQPTVVTGSARLDAFRHAGDSLAGRFFQFRLHPLDLKELSEDINDDQNKESVLSQIFEKLWEYGPFPEPFLKADPVFYRRWKASHLEIILKQDLQDLSSIRDIKQVETLVLLLKERVGSPVSARSFAQDLQKDPNTIQRWLSLLESLYIVFKVTPYHHNIARAILKEPKYYFYDFCQVTESEGAKFENMVACALLKQCDYIEDTQGYSMRLHYVRTRDGKEIDFLTVKENRPQALIEAKLSVDKPSSSFKVILPFFEKKNLQLRPIQVVKTLSQDQEWYAQNPDRVTISVQGAQSFLTRGLESLEHF